MVTKEQVLSLRAQTGAGVMDCRSALEEAGGDEMKAREILRVRGSALAAAKAGRIAAQGVVGSYVHGGGTVAAIVLVRCETDFVAKSAAFQELARDLAMQVAAMDPQVLRAEDVPAGGRAEEIALLAQTFIKDPSGTRTVRELLEQKVLEFGEKITVERFSRFAV